MAVRTLRQVAGKKPVRSITPDREKGVGAEEVPCRGLEGRGAMQTSGRLEAPLGHSSKFTVRVGREQRQLLSTHHCPRQQ
jgi:hypothetical protein